MSAGVSKKSFDCLEFKQQIQEKLQHKYAGLNFTERHQKIEEHIANGPLADFWQRLNES